MKRTAVTLFTLIFIFFFSCGKEDQTPPVVTLNGERLIYIGLGETYTDSGATAYDEKDGELAVQTSGEVNTQFAGTYILRYYATDMAGNGSEAIRTVVVENSASFLNGNYTAFASTVNGNISFPASVASSTEVNGRIWFSGFGRFEFLPVFGDLTDTLISVPVQTSIAGNPSLTHYLKGNGYFSKPADTLYIHIVYSDSTELGLDSGQIIYKSANISFD